MVPRKWSWESCPMKGFQEEWSQLKGPRKRFPEKWSSILGLRTVYISTLSSWKSSYRASKHDQLWSNLTHIYMFVCSSKRPQIGKKTAAWKEGKALLEIFRMFPNAPTCGPITECWNCISILRILHFLGSRTALSIHGITLEIKAFNEILYGRGSSFRWKSSC